MNTRSGLILVVFGLLAAVAHPAAAQAPRDNNFTALAGAHLQEAQGEDDPVKAAEAYERGLRVSLDGIESDPDNSQSYFHAGVAYIGLRDYAKADSMLDIAEEMHPEYHEQTDLFRENGWIQAYNDGIGAMEEGDWNAAINQFSMANLVFDRRPEAYLNLGSSYANQGELESSMEAYGEAVTRIDLPENQDRDEAELARWQSYKVTAWLNSAQILVSLERPADAITYLEQILEIDPENQDAKTNLAVAMAASGQGGDATGIYEDIIQSPESNHIDLYNAGVGLYQAENYAMAVRAFEAALQKSPMFRDALQNVTQALAQAAREDETLWDRMPEYTGKLVEMDPHNELAFQLHGIALARTGSSDEAVALDEKRQALSFVIESLQLQPAGEGIRVVGAFVNRTMEQGVSTTLRFTFYDSAGDALGTADAEVVAPAQEMAEVFRVEFQGSAGVSGYSYEVIGS